MAVRSHFRFVAGVCVVAVGMLMAPGGAVAVADPGSSGSVAHGKDGADTKGEKKDVTDTRDETKDVTDTKDGSLGSDGQPGQQPSTGAKKPKDEPGGTDTKDRTRDDSDLGVALPDPVATVPNEVTPVSAAVAPVSDPVAAVPNEVTPVSAAAAPVPDVVGPVSNVSALVQDMLTSVVGAVVPLTQLQSDLYSFLLGIAGVAPVSNVSALVQDMLSSVVGAVVLLAQLPSDLFSFLLGIAGVQPVAGGVAGIHGPGLSTAAGASVASRLPLGLPPAGVSGPPVAGVSGPPLAGVSGPPLAGVSGLPVTVEATGVATLDVIALGRASAVSGMAPPASNAAFPIGAGSAVFGALLLPVSLWALAAAALPGAGGLGFITVAGVRVGYRQAKAGVAVRPAGIACFARLGPLGIVRSGSLVEIRPRALPVVRPAALSAGGPLDKVA